MFFSWGQEIQQVEILIVGFLWRWQSFWNFFEMHFEVISKDHYMAVYSRFEPK